MQLEPKVVPASRVTASATPVSASTANGSETNVKLRTAPKSRLTMLAAAALVVAAAATAMSLGGHGSSRAHDKTDPAAIQAQRAAFASIWSQPGNSLCVLNAHLPVNPAAAASTPFGLSAGAAISAARVGLPTIDQMANMDLPSPVSFVDPSAQAAFSRGLETRTVDMMTLAVWDADGADGDVVAFSVPGWSVAVPLTAKPALISIPVPSGQSLTTSLSITGIRDGGGGGITADFSTWAPYDAFGSETPRAAAAKSFLGSLMQQPPPAILSPGEVVSIPVRGN